MLQIKKTKQFKKDFKKATKQNKDLGELKTVINHLINLKALDPKYEDHALSGSMKRLRDCHIEPDFLLLYRADNTTLYLVRLGTHSELFR